MPLTDTELEQVRRIAREQAREVHSIAVKDADGREWSLRALMEGFEIDRRTALQALGLIGLGYAAPRAVLEVLSRNAEAASQDNLTVPGTLDAGAVSADEIVDGGDGSTKQPTNLVTESSFGTSNSLSPGFGSWTEADANNPGNLVVEVNAQTDGSTSVDISLDVDESGGTTADYSLKLAFAEATFADGTDITGATAVTLPTGGQFQITESSDPNNANRIDIARFTPIKA